ncbi:hypothetical protein [Compostimonas suwonensis]|uniref:Uncharacterized protein n=1 Tax=Compostimonas suwonensis TaxID=1048394 RepID=A0A2M9C0I3_9MICO|nr:hypothetical protein [Compostimonas suwonensis]PJJ63839.1 hypothetical protein CLV54_1515 [Compostimonas suwonensis]
MSNMIEDRVEGDPELDRLVALAARPTREATSEMREQLASMVAAAVESGRDSRRRRLSIGAAVAVPIVVLGGAGAAFASTGIDWSMFFGHATTWADWAQNPDGAVHITLPGGASCELRFAVNSLRDHPADPAVLAQAQNALRTYLNGGTVLTDANIDAVLSENRTDRNWAQDGDSTAVPFGPGTRNDNPDVDYHIAALEGISKAIQAHVPDLGTGGIGLQSQENCDAGVGQ